MIKESDAADIKPIFVQHKIIFFLIFILGILYYTMYAVFIVILIINALCLNNNCPKLKISIGKENIKIFTFFGKG